MMKIALSGPLIFSLSNIIQYYLYVKDGRTTGVNLNIGCLVISVFLILFNNYIMNMRIVRKYIIG